MLWALVQRRAAQTVPGQAVSFCALVKLWSPGGSWSALLHLLDPSCELAAAGATEIAAQTGRCWEAAHLAAAGQRPWDAWTMPKTGQQTQMQVHTHTLSA